MKIHTISKISHNVKSVQIRSFFCSVFRHFSRSAHYLRHYHFLLLAFYVNISRDKIIVKIFRTDIKQISKKWESVRPIRSIDDKDVAIEQREKLFSLLITCSEVRTRTLDQYAESCSKVFKARNKDARTTTFMIVLLSL